MQLVVCGGTAMNLLGFIARSTKDVDVVTLLTTPSPEERRFLMAKPLPSAVIAARDRVARDFGVPDNWLNDGPADLLTWDLPQGCIERLERRDFGAHLAVHLMGRPDLICLKLYAFADNQAPRHLQDLLALRPSADELETAARWAVSQDSSEGFRLCLGWALDALDAHDVLGRLG